MHKRYVFLSWLFTTLVLSGIVSRKEATINTKSHATKTGRYYPCTSHHSQIIQKSLKNLKHPCGKMVHSDLHDAITTRFSFGFAFVLPDQITLMSHISIPLSLQHPMVDHKTCQIQTFHAERLMLSPSNHTHCSLLLAENRVEHVQLRTPIRCPKNWGDNFRLMIKRILLIVYQWLVE